MDSTHDIVLSILVISHNQRELLPRCLDSVLSQKLNVPYEVIVSDDRSTDGSKEVIQAYQQQYPGIVFGVDCNSDECDPISRSERCGWNKATVYNHARGEFFVNIDADDYLKNDTIYQHQIDLLRKHPECSMCQQQVWQLNDGEPLENGTAWPKNDGLQEERILKSWEVILGDFQGVNPTYMIRRRTDKNPAQIYGNQFDDTIITLYHLQFGSVVFTNRADYVWVQYNNSISNSDTGDDREVLYGLLPLEHALLIPKFKTLFLKQNNLELHHTLTKCAKGTLRITDDTKVRLSRYDGFIFDYLSGKKPKWMGWCRVAAAFVLYRWLRLNENPNDAAIQRLYNLLIGQNR